MRILIIVFSPSVGSIWGSLTRTIALASHFKKKGDAVAFCASGFVCDTLEKKGFKIYEMPETGVLGLPKFISDRFFKNSQNRTAPAGEGKSFGSIWLLYFFLGLARKKYLLNLVREELNSVADFKPNIILTEMDPGAYLAAYITRIPLVMTYANIMLFGINSFFWKKVKSAMNYVLGKFNIKDNLNPEDVAFNEKVLKLIPSIPALDTTDPNRRDVCYVGNLLEPLFEIKNRFVPDQGKKYIFCYFGTGSIPLKRVIQVLPLALKDLDDTICYVAAQSIDQEFSINNVRFVNYIQAYEILPYCKLTICHGGLNTITQSLEFGVPLLIFPGPIFERRFNAERIRSQGVGYLGEISDFNPEWIKERSENIGLLKENVLHISKIFKEYRGVETAYKAIKEWLEFKELITGRET